MAGSTPLAEVERSREQGLTFTFPPAEVRVTKYVAPSPYPRKFTYSACPKRLGTGRLCSRSLELGPSSRPSCGHDLPGVAQYRFEIVCFDAMHDRSPPLHVRVWESAAVLLGISANDFSTCTESEQVEYMRTLMERTPRLKVTLRTANCEVKALHLAWSGGRRRPYVPLPFSLRGLVRTPGIMHMPPEHTGEDSPPRLAQLTQPTTPTAEEVLR
ncbi:unnamed protein product [Calypogeia fissa]